MARGNQIAYRAFGNIPEKGYRLPSLLPPQREWETQMILAHEFSRASGARLWGGVWSPSGRMLPKAPNETRYLPAIGGLHHP